MRIEGLDLIGAKRKNGSQMLDCQLRYRAGSDL
jgi:hypothetical protein